MQRYLNDEPVQACPPSAGYRFRKFARRNRPRLAQAAALGLLLSGAGAFAWHTDRQAAERRAEKEDRERDERARLGRNAEAVLALLGQCEDALRGEQADRAAIAFGAAERRAGEDRAEELTGRLARCRADLALLRELDDVDTFRWNVAGRSIPDNKAVSVRWRAALAQYGVTPDATSLADAAVRVNGSLVRNRVLAALDGWLVNDRSAGLLAVLRAADPDPYRSTVREALVAPDAPAVTALTGRPEALAQPAGFAAALGRLAHVPADRRRAVLESALRARPGDLGLLMGMGRTYPFDQRDGAGERVRWYQAALAARPGNAAALNNLAVALWDQGKLDGAIPYLKEAVRLEPMYAGGHSRLGAALAEKGDWDEALRHLKESVRAAPDDASCHFNLGHALVDRGDADGAIPHLKQALRLRPKYPRAHYKLGVALEQKGDRDKAIAEYLKAIELDPKFGLPYGSLGNALLEKGEPDAAIPHLKEAIRLAPYDAGAHYYMGRVLGLKGDWDGAVAAYREAVRLAPKFAPAQVNLGEALTHREEWDGAIATLKKAIELDPKLSAAHFNLGVAYQLKGDPAGAIPHLKEAIRLDPTDAGAHNNLAWMSAAGPDRVRDGKRAVEHAARACELTGWKNPIWIATLAAAHAEVGDFDEAVEYQKKALTFPEYEKRYGAEARPRLDLYAGKKPYRDPALVPRMVAPPPPEVKP